MEMGVLNHPETVTTACFANSGLYVATGCDDSLVRLWSALSYLCLATFRRDGPFSRVLFLRFCDGTKFLEAKFSSLNNDFNFST